MQIHSRLDNLPVSMPVVTIGSFDGVHLGHVKVLERLKRCAASLSGSSVIITFEPHPRELLYPLEKRPGILTTLKEKEEILDVYGIDHLIVLKFTEELAGMSYADFVKHILVDKIGVKALVVGYDHRFGKNREGNFESLARLSEKYRFQLQQEEVYVAEEIRVSSTKIRTALELGDIETVNKLLGYAYRISGEVVHGEQIGRTIGFPTANIKVNDDRKLFPASGVYAVKVKVEKETYRGMLNIGVRPTVSKAGVKRPEVNIFDFDKDIYASHIEVQLCSRIRGERKFDTKEELCAQLKEDRKQAMEIF